MNCDNNFRLFAFISKNNLQKLKKSASCFTKRDFNVQKMAHVQNFNKTCSVWVFIMFTTRKSYI